MSVDFRGDFRSLKAGEFFEQDIDWTQHLNLEALSPRRRTKMLPVEAVGHGLIGTGVTNKSVTFYHDVEAYFARMQGR